MNKLTDSYVSVVVLVRNHEGRIKPFAEQAVALLSSAYTNFEVIFVDDGSSDGSKCECMAALTAHDGIRLIEFSRNFGDEAAYRAGLDNAIGDVVVTLSMDYESPAVIPVMVDACTAGTGIATGICPQDGPPGLLRSACSSAYHRFLRWAMRVDPVPGSSYCWAFSRTAVNALLSQPCVPQLLRFNVAQLGFTIARSDLAGVEGARPRRSTLINDMMAGASVIFARSKIPFRVMFAFAAAFLAGISLRLCFGDGMTSEERRLWLALAAAHSLLLAALWLVAEHIVRNLQALGRGVSYVILNEFSSGSTLRNIERRNVAKE